MRLAPASKVAGLTSPPKPLTPPMMATLPPIAQEATERLTVPCPPTSSTTSAPAPWVTRNTSSCHSGMLR